LEVKELGYLAGIKNLHYEIFATQNIILAFYQKSLSGAEDLFFTEIA
jgi:hypothetical protein